jgi:hypothetical protein
MISELCIFILTGCYLFFSTGLAVRTTMNATITSQYCGVVSRFADQVRFLYHIWNQNQFISIVLWLPIIHPIHYSVAFREEKSSIITLSSNLRQNGFVLAVLYFVKIFYLYIEMRVIKGNLDILWVVKASKIGSIRTTK